MNSDSIRPFLKPGLAVVAVVLVALGGALTDNQITVKEWITVAIVGSGAVSTLLVPNLPQGNGVYTYARFAVMAVSAALAALFNVIDGGVSAAEIIQIVLAALGAFGVWAVPGTPMPPDPVPSPTT